MLVRPRSIGPNPLITMDFCDESFTISIKRVKKSVVATVAAVHAHAVETNAQFALVADAFQGDLWFGEKIPFICGDAGFFAALGIVGPGFGQVEADVGEGGLLAAGKAGADRDLAVVDFAESPDVLARHADGVVAFLGKTGVVDDESAARATAKESVGTAGDFIHERAVFPWRVADGVVDGLVVKIRDIFFHALEIFRATLRLHEAKHVRANLVEIGIAARTEETTEIFHEGDKTIDSSNNML